ncbi:hypothetical protein CXB51_030385 [Gossypium anomalum]|uniref:Exocyst complex subunit EXOC6/Sec15 C-terminal domain-containing protein n=1 Tax=Gossypium anomalum TaxID=47600 RepID=A0A8J5YHA4_9ROSI|nr:hypothetical protein CXB51_030385 [Gossypium anomalum]
MEVENLWETAASKICSVLEDQFSRMQSANHLLLIKDYVSLLGVTLQRYDYTVGTLLDVFSKHRDKYHKLLLSDCQKQILEALAANKFEQMLMKKEYEYSINVLSFQIQTSNIISAFLYVAPFSSTVPDYCRIAMQVAANMVVFYRACDFFFHHAAQLSGVPLRMVEKGKRQFPLNKARDAAEEMLSGMLKTKVDGFMTLIGNVNWMTDEPSQGEKIVDTLLRDLVKSFNVNAIIGLDVDIRLLESFADNLAPLFSKRDANQVKNALAESRQLINLLFSSHPENFLNPGCQAEFKEEIFGCIDKKTPGCELIWPGGGVRMSMFFCLLPLLIAIAERVNIMSITATGFCLSSMCNDSIQLCPNYDFPASILPKGVSGYELNRGTGEFSAFLQETCNFKIDSYELSYKSIIHGVISPGRITNLKSVSVKVLFFWLDIVQVIHDGEEMEFSVGISSANSPTNNFYESPQCGCGFDCNRFSAFAESSSPYDKLL